MLKNLNLAGYTIIYPMSFHTYRNLRNGDVYLSLMLKEEGFLTIKDVPKKKQDILLTDNQFSEDYYDVFFNHKNIAVDSYHVPMTFHPFMYHYGYWNEPIDTAERINSLFCFGNFDREAYKNVHKAPFDIIDRASLIDFFSDFTNFISIKKEDELSNIIHNREEKKFVFVEKYNLPIPIQNVRPLISKFRYFLCCPGVFAPLSHNFAEAVSCGVIPVIQKNYADTIYPALKDGYNSFIFNDIDDLNNKIINNIFDLSEADYNKMKENVLNYYKENIHPIGFSNKILNNINKKKIFLNASERSVKKIKIQIQ
ncbi:hypothetical protein [Chryseobacterium binzhouense]|uniref:hypothetical protein n=1 Tax=Chryseobacterium binzhouense TaxID=2593646 RepID=UPI00289A94F4|nr:hypothetical protein [Chryseobacterium binzhouense]